MRWLQHKSQKKKFPWRLRVAWRLTSIVIPWLHSSQESYFEYVESLVRPKIRILDLGGGKGFLSKWLPPHLYRRWTATIVDNAVIFNIDCDLPSLRKNPSRLSVCALAEQIPFLSSSFDLVTASMVVEHLAQPELALREVFRVLKPGGAFLFHTPNLLFPPVMLSRMLSHSLKRAIVPVLEGGRQSEDVFPTLYRMNTKGTIASVASQEGFRIEWLHHVFTAPVTQMLGPFVFFELLIIRLFSGERFTSWRPDIICLLRK